MYIIPKLTQHDHDSVYLGDYKTLSAPLQNQRQSSQAIIIHKIVYTGILYSQRYTLVDVYSVDMPVVTRYKNISKMLCW